MYIIRVGLQVRKEVLPEFVKHAQSEAAEVPQRFTGCKRYGFFSDVAAPDAFLLYEEWQDQQSFDAFRTSDYFSQVGKRVFPMLASAPDGAYYDASTAAVPVVQP